METKLMSAEELLCRVQMGNAAKEQGTMYCVSPETFQKMKDALDHYLETGEVYETKYGLALRNKDGN